jgi:hypothetical protein
MTQEIRPFVANLAGRSRPVPPSFARGGLVGAADAVKRAGRYGDNRVVHINDAELELLTRSWGPPTINPSTGLPEFFLGGILSGIGSLVGAAAPALGMIPVVGPFLGAIASGIGALGGAAMPAGYAQTPVGQTPAVPTADMGDSAGKPSTLGGQTMFNVGKTPVNYSNLVDLAGGVLSFMGALSANKKWKRQQQQLGAQQAQDFKNFNGEPVDYTLGGGQQMEGLAPTHPSEMAGFYPEDPLIGKMPSFAQGGMPGYRAQGQVTGEGGGQDDLTLAYVSPDEYVIPADVVSHLGDGSSNAGARRLDGFLDQVRGRRTGNTRFPPKAGGALNQLMGR